MCGWAIGILAIAAYIRLMPTIHGDGISYYIYLPAWVGDRDPTFETAARDCCGGFIATRSVFIAGRRPGAGWRCTRPASRCCCCRSTSSRTH